MAEIRNIGKNNYEVERLVDDIKFSDEGMACENLNASLFISFIGKRLHDDVLHISKKPLRGELSGFLSICQAEASCISPKVY